MVFARLSTRDDVGRSVAPDHAFSGVVSLPGAYQHPAFFSSAGSGSSSPSESSSAASASVCLA